METGKSAEYLVSITSYALIKSAECLWNDCRTCYAWRIARYVSNCERKDKWWVTCNIIDWKQDCLLLQGMTSHECMNLVTGSYCRSRNKDGSHAIRLTIAKNPMLHAHSLLCVLYMLSYWRWNFHTAGMWICPATQVSIASVLDGRGPFAPVTLTLTWWPSYTNLTCTPWRYTGCENINFICQGFQKLLSVWQTGRQNRPKL